MFPCLNNFSLLGLLMESLVDQGERKSGLHLLLQIDY